MPYAIYDNDRYPGSESSDGCDLLEDRSVLSQRHNMVPASGSL